MATTAAIKQLKSFKSAGIGRAELDEFENLARQHGPEYLWRVTNREQMEIVGENLVLRNAGRVPDAFWFRSKIAIRRSDLVPRFARATKAPQFAVLHPQALDLETLVTPGTPPGNEAVKTITEKAKQMIEGPMISRIEMGLDMQWHLNLLIDEQGNPLPGEGKPCTRGNGELTKVTPILTPADLQRIAEYALYKSPFARKEYWVMGTHALESFIRREIGQKRAKTISYRGL